MPPPAVDLSTVSKTFGSGSAKQKVLHDISLTIPADGGITFIMGPSGCGKTTLISIIAGILASDEGSEVNVFNEAIHQLSPKQMNEFRQNRLGFVFQQFQLVPTLTVHDNVAVPRLIQGATKKEAYEAAYTFLEQVDLQDKANNLPRELSGGQQQRVAIARSLVGEPSLLICDEPTSSLDGETGQQIMELIQEMSGGEDRCVLIVTHDDRIRHFADRVVEMEDGRILNIENLSSTVETNA